MPDFRMEKFENSSRVVLGISLIIIPGISSISFGYFCWYSSRNSCHDPSKHFIRYYLRHLRDYSGTSGISAGNALKNLERFFQKFQSIFLQGFLLVFFQNFLTGYIQRILQKFSQIFFFFFLCEKYHSCRSIVSFNSVTSQGFNYCGCPADCFFSYRSWDNWDSVSMEIPFRILPRWISTQKAYYHCIGTFERLFF